MAAPKANGRSSEPRPTPRGLAGGVDGLAGGAGAGSSVGCLRAEGVSDDPGGGDARGVVMSSRKRSAWSTPPATSDAIALPPTATTIASRMSPRTARPGRNCAPCPG